MMVSPALIESLGKPQAKGCKNPSAGGKTAKRS
jgi:hypothetical protein